VDKNWDVTGKKNYEVQVDKDREVRGRGVTPPAAGDWLVGRRVVG
jgi:hypothetical protein